jgi:hypothetical protein
VELAESDFLTEKENAFMFTVPGRHWSFKDCLCLHKQWTLYSLIPLWVSYNELKSILDFRMLSVLLKSKKDVMRSQRGCQHQSDFIPSSGGRNSRTLRHFLFLVQVLTKISANVSDHRNKKWY